MLDFDIEPFSFFERIFFSLIQEAKSEFKSLLIESVEKIKQSAQKLTNSIQTAKPYYEARLYAAQV